MRAGGLQDRTTIGMSCKTIAASLPIDLPGSVEKFDQLIAHRRRYGITLRAQRPHTSVQHVFVTAVDRALVKRGIADGGRKVGSFAPNNFHEVPRSRRCMSRRWRRLSTAAGGKISRIAHRAAARRPGNDTAHRHGLLYVVTEFGSPNLKGLVLD
jgi:hypothetical protein